MKKKEYVSPEVEVVRITEQCSLLALSEGIVGGKGEGGSDLDDF